MSMEIMYVRIMHKKKSKSRYINVRFIIFHEGTKTVFPIIASSRQQRLRERSDNASYPAAPGICVALLSTKSMTWLLYSLLVAV